MRTGRAVSLGLVVAGLLTGTIADRVVHLEPLMLEGFRVLAVDFHTHSSMWSDGAFTPWGLALEAERQALDAIAVTGHNQVSDGRLTRRFSRAVGGPIVIGGEEVLAEGSYHMIAAGVRDVVDFRLRAADAIEAVHRQGGVTIAAHPFPDFVGWDDAAMQRLDGAEICHPNIFASPQRQRDLERFAGRQPIAAIGSSDFHGLGQMGVCRTFVFATEATEQAILDAVRAHRTVVFGLEGKVYGDPQLIRYADKLRTRIPSSDSRGSPLDWISRSTALLGFAGLLLL
jgi:predicted metal-dependent phosphoesterase TrpH